MSDLTWFWNEAGHRLTAWTRTGERLNAVNVGLSLYLAVRLIASARSHAAAGALGAVIVAAILVASLGAVWLGRIDVTIVGNAAAIVFWPAAAWLCERHLRR